MTGSNVASDRKAVVGIVWYRESNADIYGSPRYSQTGNECQNRGDP